MEKQIYNTAIIYLCIKTYKNKENLLNIKNHNSNEINNKTNIKIPIHHLDIKNNNKAKTNSTETIEKPIVNIDENNNYTIYESKMAQSQLKTYEQMRNSPCLVKQPTQSQKEAQKFFREKTDFNKNRNLANVDTAITQAKSKLTLNELQYNNINKANNHQRNAKQRPNESCCF